MPDFYPEGNTVLPTDGELRTLQKIAGAAGGNGSSQNIISVSKSGNDNAGSRNGFPFLTLTAAKNAAQSGDTIFVYPGTYNENDLLKDGVNWFFHAGAIVDFTDPGSGSGYAIFDDRPTGGVVSTVGGEGQFIWSGGTNANTDDFSVTANPNCRGAIYIADPATEFYFTGESIGATSYDSTLGTTQPAIQVADCAYTSFKVKRLYDPVGTAEYPFITIVDDVEIELPTQSSAPNIVWVNGEMHVECEEAIALGRIYSIWCADSAGTNTSSFWYKGDVIQGKIYISGPGGGNWRTWMDVMYINGDNSEAYYILGGGKHYFKADKIESTASNGALVNSATGAVGSTNVLWANIQKITSSTKWVNNTLGTTYLDVLHMEDSGGVTNGVLVDSGELHLNNAFIKALNGNAIKLNGGKAYIKNCIVNTATTNNAANRPVEVTSAGLHLMNCTLIAPASADSIYAASAKNVGILGVVMANKAKNANITLQPAGTLTVDANVV